MTSADSTRTASAVATAVGCMTMLCLVAALALHSHWPKPVRDWAIRSLGGVTADGATPSDAAAADHEHSDEHDHAHDAAAHTNSIALSEQARRSIGMTEGDVELSTFRRTITVPGMVVERRGRSRFAIIAPMTGILTRILVTEGEAVAAEQPLFEIRLTHEELVQAQADVLRSTVEVDVVRREIARLEGIGPEGLIATKTILERKYELQKLEAVLLSQRQALLLHGLSAEQVDAIVATRTLLATLTVRAPSAGGLDGGSGTLVVQELAVERGQHVAAGDPLATLVDHGTLLIEGEAFEQDLGPITAAAAAGTPLTTILDAKGGPARQVEGLRIAYVADSIAPDSRTLHFYVTLPNEVLGDPRIEDGRRFLTWRHKPGQRMQLEVPVEEWPERFVLPAEAVAQDGVENYVFRVNGDHFDREPVHVEHRDPRWVVIANDGTLFPGDRIAMSAAQQLQLAIKNQSGGAIDPHAGHSH